MRRNIALLVLLAIASWGPGDAQTRAGQPKRSIANLVADLKKGEKEQLQAIEELDALGAKAAEAAPALVEVFHSKSEDVRLGAALALGKIGKAALEPLIKGYKVGDPDVRLYVVWSLSFIGPAAKEATPIVVKALADKSAQVRRKAAYALGRIDPEPEKVVPALVAALQDSDEDVRNTAAGTLPKMGKAAVPALIQAMKGANKDTLRNTAIKTLGAIGAEADKAIPDLNAFLLDPDKGAAEPAADALAGIGAPAVETLQKAAENENPKVRSLALRSMQKIGAPAVLALVDLLGGKHVETRREAAGILGGIPVNDKSVIIALGYAAAKDKDFQVRRAALQALKGRGTGAKLAEPYIITLLTDIDATIRKEAFHTLQGLGIDPRPGLKKALGHSDSAIRIKTASLMTELNLEVDLAEPILLEGLKHKDEALRAQAAYALSLRGLQPDVVLPIFIASLKNDLASVRRQAAEAILRYGAKAKQAAPALIAALDDADDSVRSQALTTVRQVGAEPKMLFPAMVKILKKKDDPLHAPAAEVVLQVGPDVIPELIGFLKNEQAPALRVVCLQALGRGGPAAKEGLPEVIRALKDATPQVRLTAAATLGAIGADPQTRKLATPALIAALDDTDNAVRTQALSALRAVGEPKVLLPVMIKLLRGKDTTLHAAAAQVIFQVGPDAVGEIVSLLKEEKAPALRLTCLQTLAMVGPPAKDAVGELTRALSDAEPRARMTAARALGNIGPDAKPALDALGKLDKDADANVQKVAQAAVAQIKADAQKEFSVQGVLTPGDPFDRVRQQHYHVVHTYKMKEGQTYTIDLISPWDNFLRLENAKGEQLAQDDDSGGNLNARITFRAPADGWYRIIVTSYAPQASGGYTLKVR